MKTYCCLLISLIAFSTPLHADVSMPAIFGDHMVLQRNQANPVWGKAEPGEKVTVAIAEQTHSATAAEDGTWRVKLDALDAGGPYDLTVKGASTLQFTDVLIGEVWFCSGQSNMEWQVSNINHADVEITSANHPEIRLITVEKNGTQQAQDSFTGQWTKCSPDSVRNFSAVGYLFGRRIHNSLGVPVGLIDNSWGGSAAEAWVPRNVLEQHDTYADLLSNWKTRVANYTDEIHAQKVAEFKAWEAEGKPGKNRRSPKDLRKGQHRPANIYNGMVHPLIGYGIRGVIWYQGETNAGRATQYRELFPLLITTWRDLWDQGDFPFYWVQLADFQNESDVPQEAGWAELREAQTMTLDALPNTGEAVIIDAGEGRDIHPRDKQTVANRLVRWALAKDYGMDIAYQSPRYSQMEVNDGKATLTFDHVTKGGLYTFDIKEPVGFAIAGADKKFVWAEAKVIGKNQVEVWSEQVPEPVAVRYGWGMNPVVNLYDRNGLPVTPFRTDDWSPQTKN